MGIFREFPYSNFHDMNLDEIIKIVKNMLEEWAQYYNTWDNWKETVTSEWAEMQLFINNYFDNLNVQTEINNKITAMVNSGEFSQIVDPYVPPAVADWLAEHITTPETVVIDDSLTIEGACADAKATGDAVNVLKNELGYVIDITTVHRSDDGDAYQYVDFPITADHNYTIKNNSSATINVHSFTQADAGGEVVETLATALAPNGTTNKTAGEDAAAIRVYYYQGYGNVIIVDNDSKTLSVFKELPDKVDKNGIAQVNEKNTTFFSESPNLIDLSNVVDGYRLNQTGTDIYEDDGRSTTGYIDVSNIDYVRYFYFPSGVKTATAVYYVLYNASKTPLANRDITSNPIDVRTASYIRISFTTAQEETASLVDTSLTYTEYERGGFTFLYDPENVVEIKPTDDVIDILLNNKGKIILFTDGTYDVISIYKTKLGNDYFDNYVDYSSGGNNLGRGLPIFRGTTIRATEGAKFVAEYTGDNAAVRSNFSMFALESDVTLDGINATASGIRNIIHDDFDNAYSGRTLIKNCNLVADNKVIAGGLALHDYVEIVNCYIENTTVNVTADFSYHNNANSGAQSKIIVKDNYLAHGVSLRYYGASTVKSLALISNNSMINDVEYIPENSSATNDNITVLKWNNYLRT